MAELWDYHIDQLKEEIERREALPEKPEMVIEPCFAKLQKTVKEYIDFVWGNDYHEDNDYMVYVFEEALIAYFGIDIFETISEKTE